MHPGIVGALALIGTAGAIYFGSGYLNDYFAVRNADRVVETAAQNEDATGTPSSLVGDVADAPSGDMAAEDTAVEDAAADATDAVAETLADAADTMSDMAGDAVETVTQEVAALADDATEAAAEMADTVQETAQETLERVLEASPRNDGEATTEPEAAPEPGTTPVLDIVRIEPTGEAVIAGNAPQGERVGLLYNNELIADTTVDVGGDFVLIPDQPIPSGEGTMEIVVIDEAGNTVMPSQEQVAIVLPEDGSDDGFLVGVLRPNEPVDIIEREAPDVEVATPVEPSQTTETAEVAAETTEVEVAARVEPTQPVESEQAAAAPEAFVVVDAIELEGQEMWIAGGALPGTVVRLYQDNVFLGEVITGEEGRYLFEGTLLDSEGEVTVRADALVTGSADVIARAEVPFEVPLSSAQVAAAALEQVEEAVVAVEETAVEVAQAVEEQAETAVEATQEVAQDAVETVVETADLIQESAADAVETAAQAVESTVDSAVETAEQVADATVEAVTQTAESAPETPQVEVASTITPSTPPTEALTQALSEAAEAATETATQESTVQETAIADTSSEVEAPAVEIAATTEPSTAAAVTDAAPAPAADAGATEVAVAAPAAGTAAQSATTEQAATQPAAPSERISVLNTGQVIIRRGDNLWRLSRRVYGQGIRYTSIYDANRDQIGQPELIFPGQVFTLPTPQEEWGSVPGLEALDPDQIPGDDAATQ